MATDARTLLREVSCHQCYASSPYQLVLMKLALLRRWLLILNPGADTSPEALLAYAKCYECAAASIYQLILFKLVLVEQILEEAGGGGQNQPRITEEEIIRETEEGETRFTEELG